MAIPFSAEAFFDVFERYNVAVWPAQLALYALGLVAFILALRGGRTNGKVVSVIVAFLWLWMAIAYHFAFFRQINPAATLFAVAFIIESAFLFWLGVLRSDLAFGGPARSRIVGFAVVGYALIVYPLLNLTLGHGYPRMPSFGLPCPTTIFTIGIFLLAARQLPRVAFVVPLLWTVIGTGAAVQLGVREDLGLPIGAIALIVASTRQRLWRAKRDRLRSASPQT